MKQIRLRYILGLQNFFSTPTLQAQNIGINAEGSMSDSSALLDIKAAKDLLIPQTSTTTRLMISNMKARCCTFLRPDLSGTMTERFVLNIEWQWETIF
jgi:hypothetical protein